MVPLRIQYVHIDPELRKSEICKYGTTRYHVPLKVHHSTSKVMLPQMFDLSLEKSLGPVSGKFRKLRNKLHDTMRQSSNLEPEAHLSSLETSLSCIVLKSLTMRGSEK
jgi:hypothetical protein